MAGFHEWCGSDLDCRASFVCGTVVDDFVGSLSDTIDHRVGDDIERVTVSDALA